MSLVETRYEHIVTDDTGVPYIHGTTMKVVELVGAHQTNGWSAEELHFQYPYLSLGQIYSALAYYWDHQTELDLDMRQRQINAQNLRRQTPVAPLVTRLKEQTQIDGD